MKSQLNCIKRVLQLSTASMVLAGMAQVANAGVIPYPNVGTPNPTTYSFTAAATGDVIAYFAGSSAGYTEEVGMIDETTHTNSGLGLNDHTSFLGETFDMGAVNAGDTLVFFDDVFNTGGDIYSNPLLNVPYDNFGVTNHNHIYSTLAAAGQAYGGSPVGTYVAFEDLPFPGSDYNYHDDTFVFTDVATQEHSAPDAASTMALFGFALTGLGVLKRRFQS